ncbi:hypothetical protein N665_0225s0024 [Sinapis alba]|nr:hypothetical protein N665_0225s0024 [Sinapis alba]
MKRFREIASDRSSYFTLERLEFRVKFRGFLKRSRSIIRMGASRSIVFNLFTNYLYSGVLLHLSSI